MKNQCKIVLYFHHYLLLFITKNGFLILYVFLKKCMIEINQNCNKVPNDKSKILKEGSGM